MFAKSYIPLDIRKQQAIQLTPDNWSQPYFERVSCPRLSRVLPKTQTFSQMWNGKNMATTKNMLHLLHFYQLIA